MLGHPRKKEGPREAGLEAIDGYKARSGGLVIDLGEVVLGGLRTVGDELAEIFGGRLGPRDEHFAARTGEIGLDLHRFVERLGGRQLVDAGEEGLGILVERLLNVAADLGGLADGISNGSLDRGRHLLGAGIGVGGALLGSVGGALDEVAGSLGNFQALEVLERVGHRREGFLDGVIRGFGLCGHWGSLHPQCLSYGLTPSGLARGASLMPWLMVRCNINGAMRYHEIVISRNNGHTCLPDGLDHDDFWMRRHRALNYYLSMIFSENRYPLFRIMLLVLDRPRHAIGLEL